MKMFAEGMPTFVRASLAALAAGGLMLGGCAEQPSADSPVWVSASPVPPASPVPSPTRPALPKTPEDACRNLIASGALINPQDCTPLGPFMPDNYSPVKSPLANVKKCGDSGTLVGYAKGPAQPKSTMSGLPANVGQEITSVLDRAPLKRLLDFAEGGVEVSVTPDDDELDAYYTEVPASQASRSKQDVIELCLGTKEILPADLEGTAYHEGGHAAYSQLVELAAGTGETATAVRQELNTFRDLCGQELSYVVESFRTAKQSEAVAALSKLRGVFEARHDNYYTQAIDALLVAFQTQGGLSNLLVTRDKGEVSLGDLFTLIDTVKAQQGHGTDTDLDDQGLTYEDDGWTLLSSDLRDFVRSQFGYMLEGSVFKGVMPSWAGHVDTPTGNMASGIATTQLFPQEVRAGMEALPFAHRQIAQGKFASMYRLLLLLDPSLADLNLSKVAAS